MIDFTAFAHGQIQSKIWLCEELEKYLPEKSNVLVLGAWYSVLSMIMLSRDQYRYNVITSVDKDPESIEYSKKFLNGWSFGNENKVRTICEDVTEVNVVGNVYNVIVNCSCEHMDNSWYKDVSSYQLVCLQTSNRVTDDPTWGITNSNPTMEDFKAKYPMSQILFEGEKVFDYGHLCYSRYMLIGKK